MNTDPDDGHNQASSRSHSALHTSGIPQENEADRGGIEGQRMKSFSHKQEMYAEGANGGQRLNDSEEHSPGTKKRPMTGSNPFRPPVNDARGNPESAALLRGTNESRHKGDLQK